jgi:hypothetical protein
MMKIAARAVNKSLTKLPAVPETFPRLKSTAKMMRPKITRANFNILISFLYSGVCTAGRSGGDSSIPVHGYRLGRTYEDKVTDARLQPGVGRQIESSIATISVAILGTDYLE